MNAAEQDPRRILFYLDSLRMGGVERIVLNLIEALQQEGWSPVLALNQAGGELMEAVPPGIPVHDLAVHRFPSAVVALRKTIKETKASIVLSQRSYLNAIAALANLGSPSILIMIEHTLLSRWWQNALLPKSRTDDILRWILPRIYRMADAVVGISQGAAQDLEKAVKLPSGSVQVLYNPIVPKEVERLADAPLSLTWQEDEIPIVLAIGRLSPEKGFELLIRAFERLEKKARLVIVGDGPELPRLRTLAQGHPVFLPGMQTNPYPWIKKASVIALSSFLESFPTVIVEAMALGKPVVAFDCPLGPREIIEHEKNGLLVPPQDSEALIRSIERVLEDSALARRLGEGGRLRAQDFRFERTVQAYEDLFRTLISSRGEKKK